MKTLYTTRTNEGRKLTKYLNMGKNLILFYIIGNVYENNTENTMIYHVVWELKEKSRRCF